YDTSFCVLAFLGQKKSALVRDPADGEHPLEECLSWTTRSKKAERGASPSLVAFRRFMPAWLNKTTRGQGKGVLVFRHNEHFVQSTVTPHAVRRWKRARRGRRTRREAPYLQAPENPGAFHPV